MATIALNANRINQMPSMIKQVKQSVADYKNELFALKMQTLTINHSICNLDEVVNSIQASTKTQEDKIDSLENLLRESEEFISDVVQIDGEAAEAINRRKDEFYEAYYYLKPECEKSWPDKAKDVLISAAEWCKENWKVVVKLALTVVIVVALGVLSVVTGGILATILAGAFWAALSGAILGGAISGLASLFSGGSFLEGFADGALSGAITGAIMGAVGAGGTVVGNILGGSCNLAGKADKILKVLGSISKISGTLSFGLGAFDTAALIAGFFNPDSFLVKLNQNLHTSKLYNAFQFGVTITAVFTGAAYASMRERMNFPPTCFVAGTLILTAFGLVAIENIKAGDRVIATNPATFEQSEKTVVETYINETKQLIHLTIQGETITTTWNHPFYVEGKGFVHAEELRVDDKVVNVNGELCSIENCQVEIVQNPEIVYNFQVEDFHTYYVGNAGVLVHNADCGKVLVGDDGDGTESSFTWKLRGEDVTLNDVKVQEISYVKRSSTELKTLRDEFNTTTRKGFLEDLGKNVEYLRNAEFSETDILKIQNGRVPDGWQVHHKLPLDDSGTNSFDNLVLIQNEPYHKVITNYQNSVAKKMEIGEIQAVQWPIPNGNIYPAHH